MKFSRVLLVRGNQNGYLKNIPQKYIDRIKGVLPERVYENRVGAPVLKIHKRMEEDFLEIPGLRPWETDSMVSNRAHFRDRKYLQRQAEPNDSIPDEDWMIFKGDKVQVMIGEDKGKSGTVVAVHRETNTVVVENRHCKLEKFPIDPKNPSSDMLYRKEQPLNVAKCEVFLLDPKTSKPAVFEWKYTELGNRVRVSAQSGAHLRIPKQEEETFEYRLKEAYKENEKDTPLSVLKKPTFKAKLRLFEQDVLDELGIKDDTSHVNLKRTFWY